MRFSLRKCSRYFRLAHGSLLAETFITVIILSLGMAAPIVAAFNFVDTLAQVGTTVAQVDEILKAEEQNHAERSESFSNHDIEVKNVTFGYHDDEEILHGVSISMPQNSMTALVGPSGSGKSTLAKLAAGFWDSLRDIQKHVQENRSFYPQMDQNIRKKKLDDWKKAVKCASYLTTL